MVTELVSSTPIGVGLDTARYGHHITFLNQDREFAADPFGFSESREGYEQVSCALQKLAEKHDNVHFHIRVDAAGQYAANLISFLHDLPFEKTISVGEPKRNKDYRSVHFPKRKADAVESHACARFAIVERPKQTLAVPKAFVQLREVLSALESQTKRTTRLINQLHNRVSRAFPELATVVNDIATGSILNLLRKYPTAEKVAAARLSSLEEIPYLRSEKAKEIHRAAKQSTASLNGLVIEEVIRDLADAIQQSQRSEKKLEKLLERAFEDLPPGNHVQLETITGLGKLTVAALVATMVSIDRFATPNSVVNFYGVFPEENTSGFDKRGNSVPAGTKQMCQKGNDLVRKLLYMSSLSAIQNNPAIRALYARQMADNKRGDVALGHCMRKLLHLVFAIWKTGKPFDAQHYPWAAGSKKPDGDSSEADRSAPEETEQIRNQKTAAGRKGQSPKRSAVTATLGNVEPSPVAGKPTVANIDFKALRQQVTIAEVLRHIGHFDCLNGNSSQLRGPCPIHGSNNPASRSFSVNLDKNLFQCFNPSCGAHGNVLDLWSAVRKLPLTEAAVNLAMTCGIETEQRRGTRQPNKRHQKKDGVITPDAT
jgi:transposase